MIPELLKLQRWLQGSDWQSVVGEHTTLLNHLGAWSHSSPTLIRAATGSSQGPPGYSGEAALWIRLPLAQTSSSTHVWYENSIAIPVLLISKTEQKAHQRERIAGMKGRKGELPYTEHLLTFAFAFAAAAAAMTPKQGITPVQKQPGKQNEDRIPLSSKEFLWATCNPLLVFLCKTTNTLWHPEPSEVLRNI